MKKILEIRPKDDNSLLERVAIECHRFLPTKAIFGNTYFLKNPEAEKSSLLGAKVL